MTERDRAVAKPAGESEEVRVLLKLVREGSAAWDGGKPAGAKHPPKVKGPSVARAVIEDRQ